ncbi:uncharacterized protein FOMMEDRAFT_166374 [Fomitiporia mediterranea MF3/22]|uniref:uncharacterized protein n=1 Tax=Fomitiporia mediterranea (strain MF3/22) TaxID=694068 RepID=UPI0004408039|nr:uncharacterized protein FOMMEDRAFT_166374 [Fomitiporia mediterranea MF3/22]EJD06095.1 hypothetical protein FOMMEDRAFT_166374 [Fomitiporia mediterranea MF3/22]
MGEPESEAERMIFTKDGEPVKFFLHNTLSQGQKETLSRDIEGNGGQICDNVQEANTVIVPQEHYEIVKKRYAHSKSIYVELPDFVRKCLRGQKYSHKKEEKRSLGGSKLGTKWTGRTEFTEDDDYHLAVYLARRIPHDESGGRMGEGVYKDLCDEMYEEDYPWAKRHTVQSWRNRYKTQRDKIDDQIKLHLEVEPPHPDGKGEYIHDARKSSRFLRSGHRVVRAERRGQTDNDDSGVEEEDDDEEEDDNDDNDQARGRRRGGNKVVEETPSTPEQARREVLHNPSSPLMAGVSENVQKSLETNRFYQFDQGDDLYINDDIGDFGLIPDLTRPDGPSGTQATLVPTQTRGQTVPKASVSTGATAERRGAAGNKATFDTGVTGRMATSVSIPKDTQATLVPTQGSIRPSQRESGSTRRSQFATEGDEDIADVVVAQARRPPKQSEQLSGKGSKKRASMDRSPVYMSGPRASVLRPSAKAVGKAQQSKQLTARETSKRQVKGDAPYRNTRGRSRSVEPPNVPRPPVLGKRKAELQVVEEQNGEDNETTEEQSMEIVEKVVAIKEEEEEEESGDVDKSGFAADKELIERAKRIKVTMDVTPQAKHTQRSSLSGNRVENSALQPSQAGESSEDEFPTPGTRAKDELERRMEIEKGQPYTPAPGSRAEKARAIRREVAPRRVERVAARQTRRR